MLGNNLGRIASGWINNTLQTGDGRRHKRRTAPGNPQRFSAALTNNFFHSFAVTQP
jgi:hypothetical protein